MLATCELSGIKTFFLMAACTWIGSAIAHAGLPADYPLESGELVVTTFPAGTCGDTGSGFGMDPNGICVIVFDTRVPPEIGNPVPVPGSNWAAPAFADPSWNPQNIGLVFGLALDDDPAPNIYVAATTAYGNYQIPSTECPAVPMGFGPDGGGAIYRLDGTTAAVNQWVVTGNGGVGTNELPNTGPGLGNVCFDEVNRQFFVTNHEDGKIYRIDLTGTVLSVFDPFDPDDGSPGFAKLGERLWGVQVYNGRVYFAVWLRDGGRPSTPWPAAAGPAPSDPNNSIWSVGLDGSGDFLGSEQLEIVMPYLVAGNPNQAYSNPVSDIAFGDTGDILLAEHSMGGDYGQIDLGHAARVLEYVGSSGSWSPSATEYWIGILVNGGTGLPMNASGGIDYDCEQNVWATGDVLFAGLDPYGLARVPSTGNTSADPSGPSLLIGIGDALKGGVGDVEVYLDQPCAGGDDGACCYLMADGSTLCAQGSQQECKDSGGTFLGVGVPCVPDPCGGGEECSLLPGEDWCANLQGTDCIDGDPDVDRCRPSLAINTIDADGTPSLIVEGCDCLAGECGPIEIIDIGIDGVYELSCPEMCTDPDLQCQIHLDGQPTGQFGGLSDTFPVGSKITCDCAGQGDPVGACCRPILGTPFYDCAVISQPECDAIPGIYQGDGTTCDPDPCQPGACCYDADGDGSPETCSQVLDDECTALMGTYHGDGSNCLGDGNSNGIDDLCEDGDLCALLPGEDWCANLQPTDCIADDPAVENCRPSVLHVVTDPFGQPTISVDECDCAAGACGPVDIIETGIDGVYDIRCPQMCDIPEEFCQLHVDGTATGVSGGLSNSFPIGSELTCDCAGQPDDVCPLPSGDLSCANLQSSDCITDDPATGECKPSRVTIVQGQTGIPVPQADVCTCTDGICGPVTVIELPGAPEFYELRCVDPCENPDDGTCQIHVDGVATGATQVFAKQLALGSHVTCDCEGPPPVDGACCIFDSTVPDYFCTITTANECAAQGGTYQGDGTTCTPDPCPQVGACCYDADGDGVEETCQVLLEDECIAVMGTFHGDGSNCLGDGNLNGIDDLCEDAEVCPLLPGEDWCANLQPSDCLTDDPTVDNCRPSLVQVVSDATGQPTVSVDQCKCLGDACGPIEIIELGIDGVYELFCPQVCETPDEFCQIHIDGMSTGSAVVLSDTLPVGSSVTCDCAGVPDEVCPTIPGQDWCVDLQSTDCLTDDPDLADCQPSLVTIVPDPMHESTINVDECSCVGDECGAIDITDIGIPGVYDLRCPQLCEGLDEVCQLHVDGMPTGQTNGLSNTFPIDSKITCDCAGPTDEVCPLIPGQDICLELQATDCITDDPTVGPCMASRVHMVEDATGLPIPEADACTCNEGLCGPISVSGGPEVFDLRCIDACEDPTEGFCQVHVDGMPTGNSQVISLDLPIGSHITCDCAGPPEDGACCRFDAAINDYVCVVISASECAAAGGIYQGDGTSCTPDPCPDVGACCYDADGDGTLETCQVLLEDECIAVGGVFHGDGSNCLGDGNLNGVDDLCEEEECIESADGSMCTGVCFDPSEECVPTCIRVDFSMGINIVTVSDCDCRPVDECHAEIAGGDPFCVGGCPDGFICNPKTTFVPNEYVETCCKCEHDPPIVCPMPPDNPECSNFQFTDCNTDDPTATECLAGAIQILEGGGTQLLECGCFDDTCGPVTRTFGPVPGATLLSCEDLCEEAGDNCVIHVDGVSTGKVDAISDTLPVESVVTCECAGDCATPPDDMTGWWTLDELSGTTSADLLNGNDGTQVGGPTPLPGEYVDNSLCLNGTSQYVEIPDAPELNFGTGDFTIDAWIRSSQTTGVRVILDKRNEGATVTGYSLYLVNGMLAFQIADGAGSALCAPCPTGSSCTNYGSGAFVADGQWHHVAVTVERVTNGGTFFVDGAPVGTFNPDCHPNTVTNTFPLRFGSRSSSISGLFGGCIDEVELFNRSLEAAEIASIYNAGVNGKCKPQCADAPSDLVSWWKGDQCLPNDFMGQNHGAFVGFPFCPIDWKVGGGALGFDGSVTYVVVPDSPSLNFGTGEFSIDSWVKTTATGYQPIVEKGPGFEGYSLSLSNGLVRLVVCDTSLCAIAESTTVVNDDNWHLVIGTMSRVGSMATLSVYVDGVLEDSSTVPMGNIDNTDNLLIGAGPSFAPTDVFAGVLDEVEIFSRALTSAEVGALWDAGCEGKCADDCNNNGVYDGADIANGTSVDNNDNGIPDECETFCPHGPIDVALPVSGTVDARQPHLLGEPLLLQGIGGPGDVGNGIAAEPILIDLGSPGASPGCFTLCETAVHPVLGPNGIASVVDNNDGTYTLLLDRPITANAVTTISYVDGSFVEYTSHPANVNADAIAGVVDVLALIDVLTGQQLPVHGIYSTDIDHSGALGAADVLRTIDLLNGSSGFPQQNLTPLPLPGDCPTP